MDTNRNTANNYQINTFVKGMNSDTSYDMIGADQYLFGQNIRITNNTLLFGNLDSNNTEQIIAPVPVGYSVTLQGTIGSNTVEKILATSSIGNTGTVVVKYTNDKWGVYKFEKTADPIITYQLIYTSTETTDKNKFSVVMVNEVEGVVKVYIADGNGSPVCLFLENNSIDNLQQYYSGVDTNLLRAGMYFPRKKATLQKTTGNLVTQQVQYTYRFYKQYGYVSKLAPLTNKIQVISSSRSNEQGNAENTATNIGFNITISKPSVDLFDHLQIFRISYIKYGQTPNVYLIYDKKLDDGNEYTITDSGSVVLQEYSIDEFSALQTQVISPEVIESNQGYLFCANATDGTILDNGDIDGVSASNPGFVNFEISIGSNSDTKVPIGNEKNVINSGDTSSVYNYLVGCGINPDSSDGSKTKLSYDDMFVSSLMRSLRVGEKYNYGIVYYDKYGRRSNVQKLPQVSTTSLSSDPLSNANFSNPIGIQVTISGFQNKNLAGFEIVRQAKDYNNTENLLQVALSRPVRQGKYSTPEDSGKNTGYNEYRTPYYPNIFLTSQFVYYDFKTSNTDEITNDLWCQYFDHNATNVENFTLFQIFAPAINFYRNDTLATIHGNSVTLNPIYYWYENNQFENSPGLQEITWYNYSVRRNPTQTSSLESRSSNKVHKINDGIDVIRNYFFSPTQNYHPSEITKTNRSGNFILSQNAYAGSDEFNIKTVKDVKNPQWGDAFSNLQFSSNDATKVSAAIKQYQSYLTIVGQEEYNNWASGSLYNLAASENEADKQIGNHEMLNGDAFVFHGIEDTANAFSNGIIGPGPVCLLAELEKWEDFNDENRSPNSLETQFGAGNFGTLVCNIKHSVPAGSSYSSLDPYFGFGNYYEFPSGTNSFTVKIFDGDVYNDYAEFVNLFKTYDFNDHLNTLQSEQIVYYIPMESEVNVRFDYGHNYRNTRASNLLLEPGQIEGITSQDRPLHQYNRIYSDNNRSINTFYEKPDNNEVVQYPNRIYYSQLKTNGELIDNWQIFKPADFIDADSRYGDITELLSRNNELYFWQSGAFGKLSVNERSLITDDNGETIQLGQGGVLQRTDYLSTKYGMRKEDFCSVNTEDAIYWIDFVNKAIVQCKQNQVVNYGEYLNVQNIINSKLNENIEYPTIHYDLQTNELLCKCFIYDQQLIFNTKFNIATSVYNRNYQDVVSFNNVLIGLYIDDNHLIQAKQYNYLGSGAIDLMSPTVLKFVINSSASQTKVFDNQKVITLSRNGHEEEEYKGGHLESKTFWNKNGNYQTQYIHDKEYEFKTDMRSTNNKPNAITDREGNIVYDIPRVGNNDWGDRIRGKWMVETITDNNPKKDYCISHIITKFRQSYS